MSRYKPCEVSSGCWNVCSEDTVVADCSRCKGQHWW